MKKILITLLFLTSIPLSAAESELHIYKNPIPYGNYITDLEGFLRKAISRNRWLLETDDEGRFYAVILHKGYDMRNELVIENNTVRVQFISVTKPACTKKKSKCVVTEERIRGWLVKLRRTIAYDLTRIVQKDAEKRIYIKQ